MNQTQLDKLSSLASGLWHIDLFHGLSYFSQFSEMSENIESIGNSMVKDLLKEREKQGLKVLTNNGFVNPKDEKGIMDIPNSTIAKIELNGAMRLNDSLSTKGIRSLSQEIQFAKYNDKIKGLLIEVTSGGGEAIAGSYLYDQLKSFGKPIVSAAYLAASAAYKAILPSNEIIGIGESSEFGSIGSFISIEKSLLEYIRENFQDIYSRRSPQKNKAIRELVENKDSSLLLDELDNSVLVFHSLVLKERDLNPESKKTKDALEGGMFFSKEAKSIGLIDQIGTTEFAIKRLYSYIK